ncbi:hypothetical protein JCM9533A_34550 [Catenuloplanes niger JCM 9533]
MADFLDFDPRDASPFVLGMVVERRTGVTYGDQCGGLLCLWRTVEDGRDAANETFRVIDLAATLLQKFGNNVGRAAGVLRPAGRGCAPA